MGTRFAGRTLAQVLLASCGDARCHHGCAPRSIFSKYGNILIIGWYNKKDSYLIPSKSKVMRQYICFVCKLIVHTNIEMLIFFSCKGVLRFFLEDLGKAKVCSSNTVVIHLLIH